MYCAFRPYAHSIEWFIAWQCKVFWIKTLNLTIVVSWMETKVKFFCIYVHFIHRELDIQSIFFLFLRSFHPHRLFTLYLSIDFGLWRWDETRNQTHAFICTWIHVICYSHKIFRTKILRKGKRECFKQKPILSKLNTHRHTNTLSHARNLYYLSGFLFSFL